MQNQVNSSLNTKSLKKRKTKNLVKITQNLESKLEQAKLDVKTLNQELKDKDDSLIELYECVRFLKEEQKLMLTFLEFMSSENPEALASKIKSKTRENYMEHLKNGLDVRLPMLPTDWQSYA